MHGAALVLTLMLRSSLPQEIAAPHGDGVLKGLVEDPSGKPIPDARVKIESDASRKFETKSDDFGAFAFSNIPQGEYTLTVRAEGFEVDEVVVKAGGSVVRPIRVRLDIAEVKDEITVTADRLSSPSAEQNIDAIELDKHWLLTLPVRDGDPLAVPSFFLDPALNGSGGPKIIIDGVEASGVDVPIVSLKRVYVNRNPYTAEFGRPGKGRIEITTRRGDRHDFQGSLSMLLRNSALDARNAFAVTKPLLQRDVPEVQLDGPLGRGRSFYVAGRYFVNNESAVVHAVTPDGPVAANFRAPERNTIFLGRLDFKLRPTHRVAVSYRLKDRSRRGQNVGGTFIAERETNIFHRADEVKILDTSTIPPRLINEFRLQLKNDSDETVSVSDRPAIVVLGALHAGGAQMNRRVRERSVDVQDISSLVAGRHSLRFGVGVRPIFFQARDASNFGGTWTFSSLETFAEGRPLLFAVNRGEPAASYTQHEFYAFVQDEVPLRPNFSVSFGLRHEMQSNSSDRNNFGPRLAFAYSPGRRPVVLRGGAGVFYERQPASMVQQSLLYGGSRIYQMVVRTPQFPAPDGQSESAVSPSVVHIEPGIRMPYLIHGGVGIESKLGRGNNYFTAEYATTRGVHLYRMRNVNAPLPESGARPDTGFLNINKFESSGASRGHALTINLKSQPVRRLEAVAQYTLSKNTDDTAGFLSVPADNYNLKSERGRADFDRRHRFNFMGIYKLPHDVKLSGIVDVSSSPPFNITTGFDENRDTVANDRPAGISRNTGQGRGYMSVDMRLLKEFEFEKEKRTKAELAVDAFNLLNRVNFKNYVGTLSSPLFGQANAAHHARQLQILLRLRF